MSLNHLTAKDLLFQPRRSVTTHHPGLEEVQGEEGVKKPHFAKSDRQFFQVVRHLPGSSMDRRHPEPAPARRRAVVRAPAIRRRAFLVTNLWAVVRSRHSTPIAAAGRVVPSSRCRTAAGAAAAR